MGAAQLTAVLALHATPTQMSLLAAAATIPGLLVGPFAGVSVDRLRRRPILVGTNLGKALLMASIPIAFYLDTLRMEQLYVVAFLGGSLTFLFDVAYRSYLPSLVERKDLVEANSKLSGSASVVEVVAFSLGGWISQLISAIAAAMVGAGTFLASALSLAWIRKQEAEPARAGDRHNMWSEIGEGVKSVWREPLLRSLAVVAASQGMAFGVFGALWLVYGIQELGFGSGALGTIAAVGGVSSFGGAVLAGGVASRLGMGRAILVGLLVFSVSMLFIPLAHGPLLLAGTLLAAQQLLGDGGATISEINQVSLRQAITPARLLGRVSASLRLIELGAMLAGSLIAGALGETIGMRPTMVAGATCALVGVGWLAVFSPMRKVKAPTGSVWTNPDQEQ